MMKKGHSIHPSSERMEAIASGGNQLKQQFKPGDTTWMKIHSNSWWPAQVVDEKTVGNKPKKKAKDEILVRQYGTYKYLYMDPWKSSSEFEKFLKQENCNAGEAFQKSLEEDLLRMKSAGKSKRKVSKSEENSTVEAPKVKKQKQDKIQRNQEAIGPVSTGCPSDKLKEVRAEQGKDKHGDGLRKPNTAEKGRAAGSKIKITKQYNLRQPKRNNVEKQVKGHVKDEAFKDKVVGQGEVKEQVTLMVGDNSLTGENIKRYIFRNQKHKDVKNQVSIGQRKEGRQDVARKAVNGGSKFEMMKHDCLRKLKHKYDKEERTEKNGDKVSKHNKTKQGKEGRSSVIENATDGVSYVKSVMQMGSRLPKHNDTKEHIESPGSTKYGTPQDKGDLSARRTRVMQSLGLIAPLGSPFRRNGLVEAAVLKL